MHGTDEEARYPERDGALVALEAIVAAAELGFVGFFRVQRVKNDALPGVKRGQLEHVAALDEANRDLVIEVARPRRARRDFGELDARFREDQDLRIDVDPELMEYRGKIARAVRVVLEFDLPGFEALFQTRDGVGGRLRVVDGGIIERDVELVFEALLGKKGGGEEKPNRTSAHRPIVTPVTRRAPCRGFRAAGRRPSPSLHRQHRRTGRWLRRAAGERSRPALGTERRGRGRYYRRNPGQRHERAWGNAR